MVSFANLVDDKFLRDLGAVQIEEDWLVSWRGSSSWSRRSSEVRLTAVLTLLFVDSLEFDSDVANLLGLVLAA